MGGRRVGKEVEMGRKRRSQGALTPALSHQNGRGRKRRPDAHKNANRGTRLGGWGEDGVGGWGVGNGGEKSGKRSRNGEEEEKAGSPHPGPLPSEWEREEEKTRCA